MIEGVARLSDDLAEKSPIAIRIGGRNMAVGRAEGFLRPKAVPGCW